MKRAVVIVAAIGLVPVVVWGGASAGPEPPVDCTPPTTAADAGCVAPAPAAPVEPAAPPETTTTPPTTAPPTTAPPTTAPPTAAPPTTAPPPDSTTVPPATSTTVASTPTTAPESTTTTTTAPGSTTTTTVDPAATTTTSTTVDPAATTTTTVPAPPPEDLDSDPIAPPVEAPGGRVVVPAGAAESGQLRPIAFPVAGPVTYVNDWGACRDGCNRAHKGNDLIGDRLQPILAMQDGVVDRLLDHPTAGYGVVIRDDEGWEYHVYHLNNDSPGTDDGADAGGWRFLPGIVPGARVTAGQQIGWMGDSGNSEGSVPHAHVEIHTPAGTAINPYWSLRAAQRAANCAVGTVGQPDPAVAAATLDDPDGAAAALAAPEQADPASAAAAPLAATTMAEALDADPAWLATGWSQTELPKGWGSFTVTGGRPNTAEVAARFWISQTGFTPVDAAALRVGDARYDAGVDCASGSDVAVAPIPAEMALILATIRHMESGGDYGVQASGSTASGAYGFLDSSWGGFGGYARAKDAPPPVQDAKAAEFASAILARNGGDVTTIPVTWYIGHVPVGDEWDTVPKPEAGNRITPREYQRRWMNKYNELLGNPGAWSGSGGAPAVTVDTSATCRTVLVDVGTDDQPQYVLTQAQSFLAHPDGRAVPNAVDACDPGRALAAAPSGPDAPDLLAKLEEPPTITEGPH